MSLEAHRVTGLNLELTIRQDIAASTVCNVKFNDTGLLQSTLPVAQGGLGLYSTANVSLSAYASSLRAARQHVGQILQNDFESCPTSEVDSVAESWTALGHEPLTTDMKPFQGYWSTAVHKVLFHVLKADAQSSHLACIMTAAQSRSGD